MSNSYIGHAKSHPLAVLVMSVACLLMGPRALAAPVIYTGFVVTDVQLGSFFYHNAAVTFTFYADTKDIRTFNVTAPDSLSGSGFLVDKGRATVTIRSGSDVVHATFVPHQILVSLDAENGGVGFSSYVGPSGLEPAYPLGFVGGTSPTRDLSTPANVTGNAWSCVGYPPNRNSIGDCFDALPLNTDHGSFFIYSSYESYFTDGTLGSLGGTMARGIFSIVRPPDD